MWRILTYDMLVNIMNYCWMAILLMKKNKTITRRPRKGQNENSRCKQGKFKFVKEVISI